jgi:hypothetical protein
MYPGAGECLFAECVGEAVELADESAAGWGGGAVGMRGGVRRDAVSDSLSVVRAYQLATGTVRAGRECPPLKIEIWVTPESADFYIRATRQSQKQMPGFFSSGLVCVRKDLKHGLVSTICPRSPIHRPSDFAKALSCRKGLCVLPGILSCFPRSSQDRRIGVRRPFQYVSITKLSGELELVSIWMF